MSGDYNTNNYSLRSWLRDIKRLNSAFTTLWLKLAACMIVTNLCLYKILPAEHRGISEQEGNATEQRARVPGHAQAHSARRH